MHLIAVLNKEIPFAKAVNAVAHLALAVGAMIPKEKMPNIQVKFASAADTRNFRAAAKKQNVLLKAESLFFDYTHQMTQGDAIEQIARSKATPEAEMDYYAVILCLPDHHLASVDISKCDNLIGYQPQLSTAEAKDFIPQILENAIGGKLNSTLPSTKIIMVMPKKSIPQDWLNSAIQASIQLAQGSPIEQLGLEYFNDQDEDAGSSHVASVYPYPILTTKSTAKQQELTAAVAERQAKFFSWTSLNDVICVVGSKLDIESIPGQNKCSMLNKTLGAEDYVSVDSVAG